MNHELFSEINPMYAASKESSNAFRMEIRLKEAVDGDVLRHAVDTTMKRYPYFCVELKRVDGRYVFADNDRPVTIFTSPEGVELCTEAAGYHMLAFGFFEDTIYIDCFHALTDGTGSYALMRTLLYYYCSEAYNAELSREGIRLLGDEIPQEEWDDPAQKLEDIPASGGGESVPALNPKEEGMLQDDNQKTTFGFTVDESEFLKFSSDHDGSPGTITALFLARTIRAVHPDVQSPVRISLCVNQRKAMKAPLAHQSLVGGAWLEYKKELQDWPLDRQATAFRGMVFVQTMDDKVLETQCAINRNTRTLLSLDDDKDRVAAAKQSSDYLKLMLSASVSYVGKANIGDAEKYIQNFHALAFPMNENILIEVAAAGNKIIIDIMQNFSDQAYVNAFMKQLDENGIHYEFSGSKELYIPGVNLPWL